MSDRIGGDRKNPIQDYNGRDSEHGVSIMQSVYRLNANDLDDRFLESLKTLWGDREIEIVISEVDETSYLMANEANRLRLLKAVSDVKQGEKLIEFNLEESA
jgi:antitoxin YefM